MGASTIQDEHLRIGQRLRECRKAAGITLREFARQLEVSPATWSAVENGRTRLSDERLGRAAKALGVALEFFEETARSGPSAGDWRLFAPLALSSPLTGALDAFVELGYHGATIRDIAQRGGLSVPGIYHHWESKQALLVALLELTMDDLLARSRQAVSEAHGPIARFRSLIECLALFHTHRRDLGFIGASEMRSLEEPARSRLIAARTEQQRMVDREVLEGRRRGLMAVRLPREAARAVVTMCTALPQWWSPSGRWSPADVAAQYVEFACDVVQVVG